jgi:DNA replication protein DnaC
MQTEHLIEKMTTLKLTGMVEAFKTQALQKDVGQLSFSERLGLLLDHEILHKEDKRLTALLRRAKLRESANIESIKYKASRKLVRTQILSLAGGAFIKNCRNLVITGATGVGKTYLACAIANSACRLGYKTKYLHLPRFIEALSLSHLDGSYHKQMQQLQKFDLIILDDFGLTPITAKQCHDLFNIIEDRYKTRSTIITSQLPVNKWHDYLGEPTLADAILDRLLEHVERIEIKGDSMRNQNNIE